MANSSVARCVFVIYFSLLAATTAAMAQMGGLQGGYSGMMGSQNALGGMFGGSLAGMMGGGAGLSIGNDGTLYLTRSAPAQGQSSASTQLAALDVNGNLKWTLVLDGSNASQPVIGKDGMLFLTTSGWTHWMYEWMFSRSAPTGGAPKLLVIKSDAGSATITATVTLTGQLASAPQIASDNAGNYVVYVVCVDAFSGTFLNAGSTAGSYLYAFSPNGTLRYKLQLSQGGYGIMGPGMMGPF